MQLSILHGGLVCSVVLIAGCESIPFFKDPEPVVAVSVNRDCFPNQRDLTQPWGTRFEYCNGHRPVQAAAKYRAEPWPTKQKPSTIVPTIPVPQTRPLNQPLGNDTTIATVPRPVDQAPDVYSEETMNSTDLSNPLLSYRQLKESRSNHTAVVTEPVIREKPQQPELQFVPSTHALVVGEANGELIKAVRFPANQSRLDRQSTREALVLLDAIKTMNPDSHVVWIQAGISPQEKKQLQAKDWDELAINRARTIREFFEREGLPKDIRIMFRNKDVMDQVAFVLTRPNI